MHVFDLGPSSLDASHVTYSQTTLALNVTSKLLDIIMRALTNSTRVPMTKYKHPN